MSVSLLLCFALITVFSSFFVISVLNPVYSVLFLVLVFLGVSGMFFTLQLEFIPLSFIIVYVGAIAILFLFVVMMLDIKVTSVYSNFFKYLPITSMIGGGLFFAIYFRLKADFTFPVSTEFPYSNVSWFYSVDKVSNIEAIGQVLYTHYFIYFLISGIILLVAMIGAVSLTLQFNKKVKNQFLFRQLSRKAYNALFLVQN